MTANDLAQKLGADESHARQHIAQMMAEYLLSLSTTAKHYEWHKTGMHLLAAGDELQKMLERGHISQPRYDYTVIKRSNIKV